MPAVQHPRKQGPVYAGRMGHGRRDASEGASDLLLVQAVLRGEAEASQELARRLTCLPAMVRLRERRLALHLSDDERVETVQEIVAALWSKLFRYRGGSPLEAWAYGFVVRQHYKVLERRARSRSESARLDLEPAPEVHSLHEDERRWIHRVVEDLGHPDSAIIRMRHFDELPFAEIAGILGLPTNTAKTRYYRAVRRLQILLRPMWRGISP